jgi:hypothetical protein
MLISSAEVENEDLADARLDHAAASRTNHGAVVHRDDPPIPVVRRSDLTRDPFRRVVLGDGRPIRSGS